MVGMLRSTLVLRRFDQKPSSIVTARTGTQCNFAYGEFVRFNAPWSCQLSSSPAEAASKGPAECMGLPSANDNAGRARAEAAVEEAIVERKRRRETVLEELIHHLTA